MKKVLYRTLVALQLLWIVFATSPPQVVAVGTVAIPLNYYSFLPPSVGGSYTDASFGTSIKRLSNALGTPDVAAGGNLTWVVNEYSTMSAFNKDSSRLLLTHDSYFALYDGSGNFLRNLPLEVHAGSEPRWSRSDANVFYYIHDNQLKTYNISSGAMSVVHTFPEYSSITGKGESDICFDGNHFLLAGNDRYIFVYEISTDTKGPVFDPGGSNFNQLYITPNDNVLVGYYAVGSNRFQGIELYDRSMRFLRQVTPTIGHMDVTRDTNGDEVLIWTNGNDPHPLCDNAIVKVRLSDGQQTCLLTLDWSLAVHICAPDNNGWAFVETYAPSDPDPLSSGWKPYTNELLRVKLDGSQVVRLAHHRSRPFNSYQYQPKASVSRDGSRLVYSSNFGLQSILNYPTEYSDVYLITDSSVTGTVSGGGGGTGGGTGGTSGTTRYEQDNPAVSYSGTWSTQTKSVHSGGSAKLSKVPAARATFSFTGTSVTWIGIRDPWSGIANVYLDGVGKGQVDLYYSSEQDQAKILTFSGLTAAQHTLVIESTGTRNPSSGDLWVFVDAFDVSSSTSSGGGGTTTPYRVEENNSAVTYSGGTWFANNNSANSGGRAVLSMDKGSRASFTFTGTGVGWVTNRDAWSGIARVSIDGKDQGTIDLYSSSGMAQAVAYKKTGLPAGTHKITVEVLYQKNSRSGGYWVWIDAFNVTP